MAISSFDSRNIRRTFFSNFSQAEAGSWANALAFRVNSDRGTEEYKWPKSLGPMREWIGGRQVSQLSEWDYTLKNVPYEKTLEINEDDLRRDKTGMLNARIGDLAARAATHWETLLTNIIIAGASSNGYDGTAFFGSSHVDGNINLLTNTQVSDLNIATAADPTPAELSDAIIAVIAYMFGYVDDAGEPINQNANQFTVMAPTNFMRAAVAVQHSDMLSNGVGAVANVSRDSNFMINWIFNPRLDASSDWNDTQIVVSRTDGMLKPFLIQDEYDVRTKFEDDTFRNKRHLFGIDASRSAGYGLHTHSAKCTFS